MVAKEHTAKILKESTNRMHTENHQSTAEGERSNVERNSISSRGNSEVQRDEGLMKTEIK